MPFRVALDSRGVIVIEHNLDVIKTADWIIDLGPEGGARGGRIVAEGSPEDIASVVGSATGQYLSRALRGEPVVPLSQDTFAASDGRSSARTGPLCQSASRRRVTAAAS